MPLIMRVHIIYWHQPEAESEKGYACCSCSYSSCSKTSGKRRTVRFNTCCIVPTHGFSAWFGFTKQTWAGATGVTDVQETVPMGDDSLEHGMIAAAVEPEPSSSPAMTAAERREQYQGTEKGSPTLAGPMEVANGSALQHLFFSTQPAVKQPTAESVSWTCQIVWVCGVAEVMLNVFHSLFMSEHLRTCSFFVQPYAQSPGSSKGRCHRE